MTDISEILLSEQEVANFFGISRRAVTDLRNEGHVEPAQTKPFRYNLQDFSRQYASRLRTVAAGRAAQAVEDDPDNLDPVRESTLLKRSQRLLIDKKLEQMEGDLVTRDEVQNALNTIVQTARTRILSLPTAISSRCHGLTTSDQAAVTEACHTILEDLVSDAERVPDILKQQVLDSAEDMISAATKAKQ